MKIVAIDGLTGWRLMEESTIGVCRRGVRHSLWNNLSERKKDGQNRRDGGLLSTFRPWRQH